MKAVIEGKLPAPEPGQARDGYHVWEERRATGQRTMGGWGGKGKGSEGSEQKSKWQTKGLGQWKRIKFEC